MVLARALVLFVLALAVQGARAQFDPPACWMYGGGSVNGETQTCRATAEEACEARAQVYRDYWGPNAGMTFTTQTTYNPPYCTQYLNGAFQSSVSLTNTPQCPANSTLQGAQCVCSAGYSQSGSGASTTCTQGPANARGSGGPGSPVPGHGTGSRRVNFTIGWGRTPVPDSGEAISYPVAAGTTQCSNECEYIIGSAPGDVLGCYRSQDQGPNGMYRTSCDFIGTATGNSCSMASDGQSNPSAPEPPCLGEIIIVPNSGGRELCVIFPGGTPTVEPDSASRSPAPEVFGNPGAGNAPATGPGSGSGPARTPTTGEGGNEGGGSSAASPSVDYAGPGGVGVGGGSQTPIETCGLPGKPPCKIDETGTPSEAEGKGKMSGANAQLDQIESDRKNQLRGLGDSPVNSLPWGWSFPSISRSCSPMSVTAHGLDFGWDPCSSVYMERWRFLMAWALALATAIYVWKRVSNLGT